MTLDTDVLVIGSGFGGGVAALRAAQAGRRVIVAEMGRNVSPADMAAGARSALRLLWEPAVGLRGYFRQTVLRHVTVVGGVGVGGGSLVYAAVLLRPDDATLSAPGWGAVDVDWSAQLDPHYATAATMLRRSTNPHRGRQDEWLEQAAAEMGVSDTFGPTPQGIDFTACVQCGQCITGCPSGAKATTADTYLSEAQRLGAEIRPQLKAQFLLPLGAAGKHGWKVAFVDPLHPSRVSAITAREVVVAAGVLGTTELLLASRDRWRTMPALSQRVGDHVRTNSEAFAAILHPPGTDVTEGATISSHFYPDATTHVTNNRFPRSYGFMKWYLSPATGGADGTARRRRTLRSLLRHPMSATANARATDWHRRTTILTVMQHAENEMALRLTRTLGRWRLRSELPPDAAPIPAFLPQADAAGVAVAAASGGRAYSTVLESLLGVGATAHILGGAVIAADAESGVVDSDHRVFGYDNLRIMDGSVVPENIGVNPSWTITAMAERACARWLTT